MPRLLDLLLAKHHADEANDLATPTKKNQYAQAARQTKVLVVDTKGGKGKNSFTEKNR